jgi:hypothetical protein
LSPATVAGPTSLEVTVTFGPYPADLRAVSKKELSSQLGVSVSAMLILYLPQKKKFELCANSGRLFS